jgi:hypothetical protein
MGAKMEISAEGGKLRVKKVMRKLRHPHPCTDRADRWDETIAEKATLTPGPSPSKGEGEDGAGWASEDRQVSRCAAADIIVWSLRDLACLSESRR